VALTTALAIYFIIWWLVLFAVLPWGVRSQHETGDEIAAGTDPGAPTIPAIGKKLIWTTVVATVVFGIFHYVYVNRLISLDDLASLWGLLPRR
jgi:predicted secreted protein